MSATQTMPRIVYFLEPAACSGERRLTFADTAYLSEIQRGSGLAGVLGARSPKSAPVWFMTEHRAEKWRRLYDAGFSAAFTGKGKSPMFRRVGRVWNLSEALAIADELINIPPDAGLEAAANLEGIE